MWDSAPQPLRPGAFIAGPSSWTIFCVAITPAGWVWIHQRLQSKAGVDFTLFDAKAKKNPREHLRGFFAALL
jgi:hypothetical protein